MSESLLKLVSKSNAATSLLTQKGNFVVDDTIGVSLIFAGIFKAKPQNLFIVASNLYSAQKITNNLSSLIGEDNVLLFPSDDLLRTELVSASKELLSQRLFVLNECFNDKKKIIVAHASSLLSPLPLPVEFKRSIFNLSVGGVVDLQEFKTSLVKAGYSQVNKVNQSLQFASRGDILDIFSVNYPRPVRIEFFDNEIETIHFFDVANQTSDEELNEVTIIPATDCLFSDLELEEFKQNLNKQLVKDQELLSKELGDLLKQSCELDLENITSRIYHPRTYKYYRYIKHHTASIVDYFDSPFVFIANKRQFLSTVEFNEKEEQKYFAELQSQGRILSHLEMHLNLEDTLKYHKVLYANQYKEKSDDIVFDVRPVVYSKTNVSNLKIIIESYLSTNEKLVLALANKQQFETITSFLKEEKLEYEVIEGLSIPSKRIGITMFSLESGFELPDYKITYISAKELFGFQNKSSRFLNRFKEATILKNYDDLKPGDYVVHEYYGIGKYLDVQTIEVDGVHRDFLHIQYSGTNVLYVPLSQFRLVRKYAGREGAEPKLSNLNSDDWEKTKSKIKERVNLLADRLYQLYSERAYVKGFKFSEDDELQIAFENEFQYELTPDQKKAIDDIKKDMQSDRAMDRLLCGDVGFGKTEVAFRAIFKAISNGKQAAILCPTTLLARQHFEVAVERFRNYGVNIAVISRLVPESKQKQYIKDINEGKIHLVIGTHRLLSKDFVFKDLGLLVIDEEQRFGVEQKEIIKELKSNIDVLSLSATPIPRTLQLSLIGVRPVSQITTPPDNRTTIQTYVAPFSDEVAKELMERELSRQGQVFYIHNVVYSITQTANHIQRQIPSARIGVVHGKMDRDEIEDVMLKFYSGDIDILVATSIIENGIDIPNANLIIVEDADKFGLSQLYQIKGRVGRGGRIAYAYLFYRPQKDMNTNAQKRLKAIQDFAELGSGYKIAQRDLMIRGAGDILGPEQAGFIDSVGLDLYLKLLNEVIEEKKNGKPHEQPKPVKFFNIDAYIPNEYATKEDKIELYQDIENAKTEKDLNAIKRRIRDIYGRLPSEVELLLNKRKLDIKLEGEEFEDTVEYPEAIELILSKKFSSVNGIGSALFESLSPYLEKIQVTYLKRVLKIRLKKEGNWLLDFKTIVDIIVTLYDRFLKK